MYIITLLIFRSHLSTAALHFCAQGVVQVTLVSILMKFTDFDEFSKLLSIDHVAHRACLYVVLTTNLQLGGGGGGSVDGGGNQNFDRIFAIQLYTSISSASSDSSRNLLS